jgi:hypothetical protein
VNQLIRLSVAELQKLDDAMRAAHLRDYLTACGCSKTTLRVCASCATVTCACKRSCRCLPEMQEVEARVEAEVERQRFPEGSYHHAAQDLGDDLAD